MGKTPDALYIPIFLGRTAKMKFGIWFRQEFPAGDFVPDSHLCQNIPPNPIAILGLE
ncbi:hypothetical protein XNC1_1330 [Xenorhabdus nematophila ATCC 19061]|uniref:Uncharacterized protein n=1 Tax=Xenorhabdus nematophila (strain ATCC 19061 / DSM 3370 / CCUG 14189 / LMG 1036 / NCIMB 9965 / AN6) TaxID=406817 RepID=D3VAF9_XENNA|nr:hypothetical protein XNC1_1330 [Xenorhabdus nematophila ATCC 19061]